MYTRCAYIPPTTLPSRYFSDAYARILPRRVLLPIYLSIRFGVTSPRTTADPDARDKWFDNSGPESPARKSIYDVCVLHFISLVGILAPR